MLHRLSRHRFVPFDGLIAVLYPLVVIGKSSREICIVSSDYWLSGSSPVIRGHLCLLSDRDTPLFMQGRRLVSIPGLWGLLIPQVPLADVIEQHLAGPEITFLLARHNFLSLEEIIRSLRHFLLFRLDSLSGD